MSMAAESDGEPGMVASTVEEQPMDLSKRSKKTTRLVPPLIPISMLPSGFHQRRFLNLKRSASEDSAEVEADSDWRMTPKRSRLDRARSVPQLNPLPALQRHKSLSESRIAQPVPEEPCPYLGYYSQMLHHFQAKCVLEQQMANVQTMAANSPEDVCDLKRRQARPLTGKHVRPGTGASPATLLSLRRKIQQRQQNLTK